MTLCGAVRVYTHLGVSSTSFFRVKITRTEQSILQVPYFMFCWPCISMHPCSEKQLDALFILSLFRLHVSGISVAHHQEVNIYIYIQQLVGIVLFIWLSVVRVGMEFHNTYQLLYTRIYITPPDDGLPICPKHIEVDWRNKLWINSASSWFSLHGTTSAASQETTDRCFGSLKSQERGTWKPVHWKTETPLTHNFLYSLTICLLHYYPRHVSSINMPTFRRKNCIHTASDAVWIQFFLLKMGMLILETCRG